MEKHKTVCFFKNALKGKIIQIFQDKVVAKTVKYYILRLFHEETKWQLEVFLQEGRGTVLK